MLTSHLSREASNHLSLSLQVCFTDLGDLCQDGVGAAPSVYEAGRVDQLYVDVVYHTRGLVYRLRAGWHRKEEGKELERMTILQKGSNTSE